MMHCSMGKLLSYPANIRLTSKGTISLNIKGLFATLSINDLQDKNTAIKLSLQLAIVYHFDTNKIVV
jgi:hypothetical protein